MGNGVNSAIGKIAQSPVEVPNIVDTVNVTTLLQHMVERIALLMAQLTSKQRDVMKIHAQVSITNKHTNFNKLLCSRFSMFYIIIILCFIKYPIFLSFIKISVNGGWGGFGDWEECPVSCGGAEHSRYRECSNPAPAHGGHDCTVDGSTNVETVACNETPCPGRIF